MQNQDRLRKLYFKRRDQLLQNNFGHIYIQKIILFDCVKEIQSNPRKVFSTRFESTTEVETPIPPSRKCNHLNICKKEINGSDTIHAAKYLKNKINTRPDCVPSFLRQGLRKNVVCAPKISVEFSNLVKKFINDGKKLKSLIMIM